MRKCANNQLSLVRLLDLQEDDRISVSRIEAATAIWARPKGKLGLDAGKLVFADSLPIRGLVDPFLQEIAGE